MTSVLRKYSQIDSRIRYFVAVGTYDPSGELVGVPTDYDSGIIFENFSGPYYPGPVVKASSLSPVTYFPFYIGTLLKDLGQQVVLTDDNNNHTAIYRRVQVVQSIDSEGVGGSRADSYGSFYVKTWAADGQGVLVTRTG
jgi:hypothetical protein